MESNEWLRPFIDDVNLLEVALSSFPEADRVEFSDLITVELLLRFEQTQAIQDLDRAITVIGRLASLVRRNDPQLVKYLSSLGYAFQLRYERNSSMEDLNRSILMKERALSSAPEDHPSRAAMLDYLASSLRTRFQHTGSREDLERAITILQNVLNSTTAGDAGNPQYLCNLGLALVRRFEDTGSIEDLDLAIKCQKEAVSMAGDDHSERAGMLSNLGDALHNRFGRIGSTRDLDEAIDLSQQAVALTPQSHSDRFLVLTNLSNKLLSRFERYGSLHDVNLAIETYQQALLAAPSNSSHRASYLNSLGTALQRRSERINSLADLDQSVERSQEAVALTPNGHPDRALYLNNLGSTFHRRFEHTGKIDDLNQAINNKDQAVACTSDTHPDLPMYLNNFGSVLQRRFEQTGSVEDLDQAVVENERAVKLSPEDHPNYPMYLSNLSIALHRRFELAGSMEDLEEAINKSEKAVSITPNDHPNRVVYINNFANGLQNRHERTQVMEDLNRAIDAYIETVASVSKDYRDYSSLLTNLGTALQRRFERTGSLEDLNQAIKYNEETREISTDYERARILNNLGTTLRRRFEETGVIQDIDQSIAVLEEAVEFTPDAHLNRATYLNALGTALQRRFERTGSMKDLGEAISRNEAAALIDTAPPSIRIGAADSAARLLINRDWERANQLLQMAVHLLPSTSPRALNPSDRQFQISQFAGITSRAVSVSIQCGEKPYRALQLSELGNGVLATLQFQVRSDISIFAKLRPDLALQFHHLRDQIDGASGNDVTTVGLKSEEDIDRRRSLSKKFDTLLATIRNIEGLELFLLAPSESELKSIARFGPIVVFNVSESRCDALIVESHDISLVELRLFTYSDLELFAGRFLNAVQAVDYKNYSFSRNEIHEVLKWIWDVAVCPILSHLGYTQSNRDGSDWARIWWVGSGLLNVLPIHAAGHHKPGSNEAAIDRVISSYTPTLKALAFAWERNAKVANIGSQKAILIGMSETPSQPDLPFVEKEIKELNELFQKEHIHTTTPDQLTRNSILSGLEGHQIAHFSCHGYSSAANPSASSLLLNDWEVSPLTVADLTSLNLQQAQMAYLSACHSASSRDFSLLGESVNLATAIQLAGYPTVVATLWQVSDEHSIDVATDVYKGVLQNGRAYPENCADALHSAVRALREKTRIIPGFKKRLPDDPLVWAPYIHLGV